MGYPTACAWGVPSGGDRRRPADQGGAGQREQSGAATPGYDSSGTHEPGAGHDCTTAAATPDLHDPIGGHARQRGARPGHHRRASARAQPADRPDLAPGWPADRRSAAQAARQSASSPSGARTAFPSATSSSSLSSAATRSGASLPRTSSWATSWVVRPSGNSSSNGAGPSGAARRARVGSRLATSSRRPRPAASLRRRVAGRRARR